MDIQKIVHEMNQIHIDHAKQLTQIANALSSSGESGVLLWLNQQEEDVFATDIIDHFGLTPGRVANIMKKLEDKGYVFRQHPNDDLRRSYIRLTETGRDFAEKLYQQMSENNENIINAFGEEQTLICLQNLRDFIARMDDGMELS